MITTCIDNHVRPKLNRYCVKQGRMAYVVLAENGEVAKDIAAYRMSIIAGTGRGFNILDCMEKPIIANWNKT